jgi:hypothetical protein
MTRWTELIVTDPTAKDSRGTTGSDNVAVAFVVDTGGTAGFGLGQDGRRRRCDARATPTHDILNALTLVGFRQGTVPHNRLDGPTSGYRGLLFDRLWKGRTAFVVIPLLHIVIILVVVFLVQILRIRLIHGHIHLFASVVGLHELFFAHGCLLVVVDSAMRALSKDLSAGKLRFSRSSQ